MTQNSQDFEMTAQQLTKQFAGKLVLITHTGIRKAEKIAGVCRQVHAIDGSVDIELMSGHRFGLVPDVFSCSHVEGVPHTWINGRRRMEVVATGYGDGCFEITKGPSREELFDALRLQHGGGKLPFTLHRLLKIDLAISGIERDGDGCNQWLLKLYDPSAEPALGAEHLEGAFNTTFRTGWVRGAKK